MHDALKHVSAATESRDWESLQGSSIIHQRRNELQHIRDNSGGRKKTNIRSGRLPIQSIRGSLYILWMTGYAISSQTDYSNRPSIRSNWSELLQRRSSIPRWILQPLPPGVWTSNAWTRANCGSNLRVPSFYLLEWLGFISVAVLLTRLTLCNFT